MTDKTHLGSGARRPDLFRRTDPEQRGGRGYRARAPRPRKRHCSNRWSADPSWLSTLAGWIARAASGVLSTWAATG